MTAQSHQGVIRAAGGILVRGHHPEEAQVAVVHRPRYDDWTLPKGKNDPGEDPMACAGREVHEETGFLARIVGPAGTTRYEVEAGPKVVDYFFMRPFRFTGFQPNDEVDGVEWLRLGEAERMLSYDFDRRLVAEMDRARVLASTQLHVVRHGAAGDRDRWEPPDQERPLSTKGKEQARRLAGEIEPVGVARVLSSPYVRCVQTVEPLADRLGLRVEAHDALAEGPDPAQISALLASVAGTTAVLCSHGDVIPAMLRRLQHLGVRFLSSYECRKGSTWIVGHDGIDFTDARYLPPPT